MAEKDADMAVVVLPLCSDNVTNRCKACSCKWFWFITSFTFFYSQQQQFEQMSTAMIKRSMRCSLCRSVYWWSLPFSSFISCWTLFLCRVQLMKWAHASMSSRITSQTSRRARGLKFLLNWRFPVRSKVQCKNKNSENHGGTCIFLFFILIKGGNICTRVLIGEKNRPTHQEKKFNKNLVLLLSRNFCCCHRHCGKGAD